jgi:hypothetical protein
MTEWIDINFALPTAHFEKYLIHSKECGIVIARFFRHKNGKIKWCLPFGGCNLNPIYVTHWARLPDEPEIEK